MKKKTIKSGIPSLREAFVVREKYGCDGDHDDDDMDVKEAGPPPIPGSTPGKPPPLPSAALSQRSTMSSPSNGPQQYTIGIMNDVLSLEKDIQVNRTKYVGLDINAELQQVKTDANALKKKVDNWVGQQTGKVMPPDTLGNA